LTAPRPILIATRNPGKVREIQAKLCDLPVSWLSLDAFPAIPDAVEDAETFEENAARKAVHYSVGCRVWTLADDSGLEVDALHGAPGVYSARYASTAGDAAVNNLKLIDALRGVPQDQRTARFRCAVAVADGQRILATAQGAVEGLIVDVPRGHHGFGYDPHFLLPQFGKTAAELPLELKNQVSHRARALTALLPKLLKLLASSPVF